MCADRNAGMNESRRVIGALVFYLLFRRHLLSIQLAKAHGPCVCSRKGALPPAMGLATVACRRRRLFHYALDTVALRSVVVSLFHGLVCAAIGATILRVLSQAPARYPFYFTAGCRCCWRWATWPGADVGTAAGHAERLLPGHYLEPGVPVDWHPGVAAFDHERADSWRPGSRFQCFSGGSMLRCDAALYKAKCAGRNRVQLAEAT
jgi:hypothetical protein